jgi:GntR family transcriptional regulator, transcriptional repressor for pyruvate dehydrogenase complex
MALTDEAIEQIRRLIRSGELPPGSRLPPEPELAAQLGLSRNSMREAVKALELVRVLDVRRGDGTYVTSLEPGLLLEGLGFAVDLLQDESILSVVEVRRLLEPPATGLAAERITDEQIASVRGRLEEMEAAGSDIERQVAADADFHLEIVAATGNQTLLSVLGGLSSRTLRARIWRGLVEADAISATLQQHRAILSALVARDRPLAEAAALIHVTSSENWLRNIVRSAHRDATSDGSPPADM